MKRFSSPAALLVGFVAALNTATAGDPAWGTVKGRVVLDATEAPAPKAIDVSSNADKTHCLSKGTLFSEEFVVNKKNLGVRWVFVWLAPPDKGAQLRVHKDLLKLKSNEVEVDQPCCAFVPHSVAVRQGQDVVVKNSSPVLHNVNWAGLGKNVFAGGNQALPAGAKPIVIAGLKADIKPISLSCNIHNWMKGYIRVFDHPYFALANEDGKFEIRLAPAGSAQLIIWHDSGWGPGGSTGNAIVVKGGEVLDLGELKLKPPE
jgi:hypothetical protein